MQYFVAKDLNLGGVESLGAVDILIAIGVLGDEGALFQDRDVLDEALFLGKGFYVAKEFGSVDAVEWVLDSEGMLAQIRDYHGGRGRTWRRCWRLSRRLRVIRGGPFLYWMPISRPS